ncbi:DUF5522 domain-containing protein [Silvanigrella aquatica]|uniref:Uncharacterized protein n=1 Tax=Silvanigrella aquatica TaxID=1915309 RepID=A0A1L4CY84_9BACT|nr:DUF5522 domain-containing protein [Silvanigrella aquatica]APJ02921.1 hypothetical protein AXG55_02905 [Silvanigrella aquatica]
MEHNKDRQQKLIENIDYYFNEKGLMVFTKEYHLKRGYCCQSGCFHCPYNFQKSIIKEEINN